MGLQALHCALEDADQLCVRPAKLAAQVSERRRRIVADRSIVEQPPADRLLLRWGDEEALNE
jgi:hypothetical protein